jgi:hypothetical protein
MEIVKRKKMLFEKGFSASGVEYNISIPFG